MSRNTFNSNNWTNRAIKYGLRKHYAGKQLTLSGTVWAPKDIVAAFDAEEEQAREAKRLHILWLSAVQTLRGTVRTNHQLRLNIKAAMRVTHGLASQVYGDFGFKKREPQLPTAATKLAAVEKRAATRELLGTKGKRQRAKIKGSPG
jgi:hypothetical protein